MTAEIASFITVLGKYIFYSEALSQYLKLDEEDQKIIEPYNRGLRKEWQEELEQSEIRLHLRHVKQAKL